MKKTALITGASSGIGKALANVFAAQGDALILVARSADKLEELAEHLKNKYGTEVKVLPKDLNQSNSPAQIFKTLEKEKAQVDILVNNAGLGSLGNFIENDPERTMESIQVNVMALTNLSYLFVRGMIARKWGRILNIASIAAFQPIPQMAVYAATKAYVLSFSESIAQELKGTGVTVTAVCPGITKTGFFEPAGVNTNQIIENWVMQTADEVAQQAYEAMKKGKTVQVTGLINQISTSTTPFVPHRILLPLANLMLGMFKKE